MVKGLPGAMATKQRPGWSEGALGLLAGLLAAWAAGTGSSSPSLVFCIHAVGMPHTCWLVSGKQDDGFGRAPLVSLTAEDGETHDGAAWRGLAVPPLLGQPPAGS